MQFKEQQINFSYTKKTFLEADFQGVFAVALDQIHTSIASARSKEACKCSILTIFLGVGNSLCKNAAFHSIVLLPPAWKGATMVNSKYRERQLMPSIQSPLTNVDFAAKQVSSRSIYNTVSYWEIMCVNAINNIGRGTDSWQGSHWNHYVLFSLCLYPV